MNSYRTLMILPVESVIGLYIENYIDGNILKRIGKNLSKLNRITIFHTFVLSNFNFCPLSWHFCSEANTTNIEKIQERALRFVYQMGDLSKDFLPTAIAWNFSGFACMQLK
jgi:hypothetical protein